MRHSSSNNFIITITVVLSLIIAFVVKAYKAGRLMELLVSSTILAEVYYLIHALNCSIPLWGLIVPFAAYCIYWLVLFQFEKVTSVKADPNWTDRDWWWELDGWDFEEEVAKVFRLNGYKAKVTKKTGDGGIDILMYKDGEKIIAQCKHYTSPVAVSVARELNGIKEDFKADKLILIASSGVTASCKDFIKNKPYFKVLDLEDIIRMGLRPHSS